MFDQITGCTVWGKDVGKMTRLWRTWNATLSSKSLFCSRGKPLEASAERRNTARVGTLTFFSLWHLPNVLFKWPASTLKGYHWIHICMIIYLSRRSQVVLHPQVRPRDYLFIFNISFIKIAPLKIFSAATPRTRFTRPTQTWMHLPHST